MPLATKPCENRFTKMYLTVANYSDGKCDSQKTVSRDGRLGDNKGDHVAQLHYNKWGDYTNEQGHTKKPIGRKISSNLRVLQHEVHKVADNCRNESCDDKVTTEVFFKVG